MVLVAQSACATVRAVERGDFDAGMLVVCEAKILHDALQSSGRTAADDGHVVQGRLGVADCAVEAWLDVGVDVGAVTDGLVSRPAAPLYHFCVGLTGFEPATT